MRRKIYKIYKQKTTRFLGMEKSILELYGICDNIKVAKGFVEINKFGNDKNTKVFYRSIYVDDKDYERYFNGNYSKEILVCRINNTEDILLVRRCDVKNLGNINLVPFTKGREYI